MSKSGQAAMLCHMDTNIDVSLQVSDWKAHEMAQQVLKYRNSPEKVAKTNVSSLGAMHAMLSHWVGSSPH